MNHDFEQKTATLQERYQQLISSQPKLRLRTAARQLDVSELELLVAGCGGLQALPLASTPQEIFRDLGELGRVMALTRNDWCVHERHGRYENIGAGKNRGLVVGPDIDLRLFFSSWGSTWAVSDGDRRSIQFFDKKGMALHKVYATPETDKQAWENLLVKHQSAQTSWPQLDSQPVAVEKTLDQAPEGLRSRWLGMKDTHEFHSVLKEFRVSRLTALQSVGNDLAQTVPNTTAEAVLNHVADTGLPFMCFVGNTGIVQIHSGPVETVKRTGSWFNVLEPHFNLHLDTTAIDQTWVVNRPSDDGWITSLECYTSAGDLIVQFFGARKPGIPELPEWRALIASHCQTELAA